MRALAFCVGLLIAASAQANIQATFSISITTPGGIESVSYRLRLVSGTLEPGAGHSQHLTIYDVPGLISGSTTQPAGWTGSVQNSGVDAWDVPMGARDNTTVPNVTWRWSGAARITAPAETRPSTWPATPSPVADVAVCDPRRLLLPS